MASKLASVDVINTITNILFQIRAAKRYNEPAFKIAGSKIILQTNWGREFAEI